MGDVMGFTDRQTGDLSAPLSRSNVSQRTGAGSMKLSYIESHHAIREANRIFGFDGWSSETVDLRLIAEAPGAVSYMARVRITVYAGERVLVREGTGHGHGKGSHIGDAHEKAAKEAESDAQKRALRHFGDQFGLALYDKAQEHVTNDAPAAEPATRPAPPAAPTISERAVAPSGIDPKAARLAAREARAAGERMQDSADAKAAIIGHLAKLVPGITTWDADWQVYAQMAKMCKTRLSIADMQTVSAAEDRRRGQHKHELAMQRAAAA
jgi:DNA recombination protein Rad52